MWQRLHAVVCSATTLDLLRDLQPQRGVVGRRHFVATRCGGGGGGGGGSSTTAFSLVLEWALAFHVSLF